MRVLKKNTVILEPHGCKIMQLLLYWSFCRSFMNWTLDMFWCRNYEDFVLWHQFIWCSLFTILLVVIVKDSCYILIQFIRFIWSSLAWTESVSYGNCVDVIFLSRFSSDQYTLRAYLLKLWQFVWCQVCWAFFSSWNLESIIFLISSSWKTFLMHGFICYRVCWVHFFLFFLSFFSSIFNYCMLDGMQLIWCY